MMFTLLVLLLGVVFVLSLRALLRQRPAAPPPVPGPYARDDAFGRPDPYAAPYPGPAAPQEGMGSALARGLATGLAVGAGAAVAQEIGHRMFEHGQPGAQPHDAAPSGQPHAAQTQSQIARDAGIGAFDPSAPAGRDGAGGLGLADPAGWDDAGWDQADAGDFVDGDGDWDA